MTTVTIERKHLERWLEELESCHLIFHEDDGLAEAITTIKEALSQPSDSVEQEPKCNPHPKAPHGFNRNASHANDRYTCECEGWDAYDAGYQAGVMAGIEVSMGQEPEQEPVAIFEKTYDGESLYDLNRDIHEAFEEEFTPAIKAVPKDEYGIHTGLFRVTIEWASDEAPHGIGEKE